MMRFTPITGLALAFVLTACGGDDGFECNLDDATALATSDWPMARHDPANTARVEIDGDLNSTAPIARCIFPGDATAALAGQDSPADCSTGGSVIATTVVVDTDAAVGRNRLIVATQDGLVHVLDLEGTEIDLRFAIDLLGPVNTPLIGADGSIFVTASSGVTRRYSGEDGEQLFSASLLDEIIVAPNIGPDGVIYAGTASGLFTGVCTNGASRFQAFLGSISVASAVTADPNDDEKTIILTPADTGRVQGFDDQDGRLLWTFFTSGRLAGSAVVVDESRDIFIVPDRQGRIFAASSADGQPRRNNVELVAHRAARCLQSPRSCQTSADCGADDVCSAETISASGALGRESFYVGTEGVQSETGAPLSPGSIYAFSLDFAGGGADWTWSLPDGGVIRSSPIVVVQDDREVVVFGADLDCENLNCSRGAVGAVSDGELLWMIELPDPVGRSSPSLRSTDDGAVIYIGTSGGKLYEIG